MFFLKISAVKFFPQGGVSPPRGNFLTVRIFRKNTLKFAKLMVEPHVCDNLSQIYGFLSFFNKKILKNVLENRLENNKMISFVHLLLYFAGIEIVSSFLKLSCYSLYMVHASPKGKGSCHTN